MSNMIEENIVVFTFSLLATQKQSCEVENDLSPQVSQLFYTCSRGVCLHNLNENLLTYVYVSFCELHLSCYISIFMFQKQHTEGWTFHYLFLMHKC